MRLLLALNLVLSSLAIVMVVGGFTPARPVERVLTAERLDIVDSTGRPMLVLANGARLPGGMFGGKEYPQTWTGRGRVAGMVFYNASGDEVGGLIYDGAKTDSGYSAVGHLSFDQWKQNQVVALSYTDDGRSRLAGLRVWDRPTDAPLVDQFELAARVSQSRGAERDSLERVLARVRERVAGRQRVFVGSQDRTASVELRDTSGRVRARLSVDSAGSPRLQFLDERGAVVAEYPR